MCTRTHADAPAAQQLEDKHAEGPVVCRVVMALQEVSDACIDALASSACPVHAPPLFLAFTNCERHLWMANHNLLP
jgi:hypothetical protein